MTAPRSDRTRFLPLSERKHPARRALPARRDDPDSPPLPARSRLREPRTYTSPDIAPRRRAPRDKKSTAAKPTPAELDRWDAEWRDEWDRGDIDDSAAYEDDTLDVADQTRDVEWLLDALDAIDDPDDDEALEWE